MIDYINQLQTKFVIFMQGTQKLGDVINYVTLELGDVIDHMTLKLSAVIDAVTLKMSAMIIDKSCHSESRLT